MKLPDFELPPISVPTITVKTLSPKRPSKPKLYRPEHNFRRTKFRDRAQAADETYAKRRRDVHEQRITHGMSDDARERHELISKMTNWQRSQYMRLPGHKKGGAKSIPLKQIRGILTMDRKKYRRAFFDD